VVIFGGDRLCAAKLYRVIQLLQQGALLVPGTTVCAASACCIRGASPQVKAIDEACCDWVHVDVMDGRFVPNITIGPLVVDALRPITDKPLDCHLVGAP
jgi:hypothetical protein